MPTSEAHSEGHAWQQVQSRRSRCSLASKPAVDGFTGQISPAATKLNSLTGSRFEMLANALEDETNTCVDNIESTPSLQAPATNTFKSTTSRSQGNVRATRPKKDRAQAKPQRHLQSITRLVNSYGPKIQTNTTYTLQFGSAATATADTGGHSDLRNTSITAQSMQGCSAKPRNSPSNNKKATATKGPGSVSDAQQSDAQQFSIPSVFQFNAAMELPTAIEASKPQQPPDPELVFRQNVADALPQAVLAVPPPRPPAISTDTSGTGPSPTAQLSGSDPPMDSATTTKPPHSTSGPRIQTNVANFHSGSVRILSNAASSGSSAGFPIPTAFPFNMAQDLPKAVLDSRPPRPPDPPAGSMPDTSTVASC